LAAKGSIFDLCEKPVFERIDGDCSTYVINNGEMISTSATYMNKVCTEMQSPALLTTEKCTLKLPLIQSWQLHTHTHDPRVTLIFLPHGETSGAK
jgi:hypothetical protein